jgi:hypothetical protein
MLEESLVAAHRAPCVAPLLAPRHEVIAKRDLLSRMIKTLICEPLAVLTAPALFCVLSIILEQERSDPLPRFSNIERCRLASTSEVTDGLVNLIGHPNKLKFTSPQQSSEHQRISSIILYTITRSLRCPRR